MSKAVLFFLVCLLMCRAIPAACQYYFYNSRYYDALFTVDAGVSGGGMNCLTDLGGKHETGRRFISDINRRATHICGGIFAGLSYNNKIGIRIEWTAGQVSGCDSILKQYTSADNGRYLRNLSFRSAIKEISLTAELYPLSLFSGVYTSLLPYLLAGIGSFSFDPQARWNGDWVGLAKLHTEGQGFREYTGRPMYSLRQMNIPLGGGIKYEISPVVNFRLELVYRQLFTDYLDDVSTTYASPSSFSRNLPVQLAALAIALSDRRAGAAYTSNYAGEKRGNSSKKDAYFSLNIKCSLVLGRSRIR